MKNKNKKRDSQDTAETFHPKNDGDSYDKKMCRICLLDEIEVKDVLISPCLCTGSLEHVHDGCLKEWIQKKQKKKSELTKINC